MTFNKTVNMCRSQRVGDTGLDLCVIKVQIKCNKQAGLCPNE